MNRIGKTAKLALVAVTLLGFGGAARAEDKPIRALFVAGGCCHDYEHQKDIITQGISARANVQWTIAYEPSKAQEKLNPVYENKDWARNFDVIVHDECTSAFGQLPNPGDKKYAGKPDELKAATEKAKQEQAVVENVILAPHKNGLPAVVLHCGMHSYRTEGWPKTTPWFDFTGLVTTGHGPKLPITITYVAQDNPIAKGLTEWTTINEEHYNNAAGDLQPTAKPLARGKQTIPDKKTGKETTNDLVVAWTNTYNGKTKVFATTIGHENATCADPRYLDMVTRGLLWSVDKLDDAHFHAAPAGATGQPAAAK